MLGMQLSLTEVLCGADVRSTAITTRYSRTVDLNWLDLSAHGKMVSISVPVYRYNIEYAHNLFIIISIRHISAQKNVYFTERKGVIKLRQE